MILEYSIKRYFFELSKFRFVTHAFQKPPFCNSSLNYVILSHTVLLSQYKIRHLVMVAWVSMDSSKVLLMAAVPQLS